jgi:hypothetical protein
MTFLGFVIVIVNAMAQVSGVSAFQIQSPVRAFSRASTSVPKLFYSVVNIAEDAPRDIEAMDEWASTCEVQRADGFQLTSTSDGIMDIDVSAMTSQDLPANTPVLFVPNNMILSSNQAMQELGRVEAAENQLHTLNASDQIRHFYLMLKILAEYEQGEDSPWYPWLNSLPRYYSNGASMTPFCYYCLPPLVASLAMQERSTFMYFDVKQVPFLSDETKANKDLIKWAFQIAYTRSFEADDGSGDLRIAPLIDMFNHGTDTEIAISYDDEGNCYAQTTVDVPAGSPLRMSYGDPTNPSYLLARYGFLDESSPATFCKIMIPHKNSQLEDMGYAHNRMLFYKETGDVSPEVFDVLLYQILGASNVKTRKQFYDAHMNDDYDTKQALHEQFWPETSAKLLEHVDTFLNELDELTAKSYGKDFYEHPRLPLILKHNEFVRSTFIAVRDRYFPN